MILRIKKDYILKILVYFVLIILLILIEFPVISMLGTAFKTNNEAFASTTLFPSKISIENFIKVLQGSNFLRYLLNGFITSMVTTVLCIIVAACAGYALSRYKGAIFRLYKYFLLILQMFPIVLVLIPLFIIFKNLKMLDTMYSLFASYIVIVLPFSIWMAKGYFDTISSEIEEAAMIDGASKFRTFIYIVFPISIPGMVAIGIFSFIYSWNEYILASIFIRTDSIKTITLGLQTFVSESRADWGSIMAASVLTTVPAVLFLIFAQKYLVQGLTAGSIKE